MSVLALALQLIKVLHVILIPAYVSVWWTLPERFLGIVYQNKEWAKADAAEVKAIYLKINKQINEWMNKQIT